MTSLLTSGQVGAIGWVALAWMLIAAVFGGWIIRKARARSKRLFVDLPMKRLGPPPAKRPYVDHRWDAM